MVACARQPVPLANPLLSARSFVRCAPLTLQQLEGQGGRVTAVREELRGAHSAVQAAMREVQGGSAELATRKAGHRDLLQEVCVWNREGGGGGVMGCNFVRVRRCMHVCVCGVDRGGGMECGLQL